MDEQKVVLLKRENMRGEAWRSLCYFLGLTGNYLGEPDENHFKSIEVTILKVEEES